MLFPPRGIEELNLFSIPVSDMISIIVVDCGSISIQLICDTLKLERSSGVRIFVALTVVAELLRFLGVG